MFFLLKARNNLVFRMNSFLYRNKRQASYHTPLAIRPTNKQNSKTASLKKTKQENKESILVNHSKRAQYALKSPEQMTCLEIDSIFHGNAAFSEGQKSFQDVWKYLDLISTLWHFPKLEQILYLVTSIWTIYQIKAHMLAKFHY